MITNYLDVLHRQAVGLERAFTTLPFKSFEITIMSGLVKVHFSPKGDRWPAVWFPMKETFDEFVKSHFPHDS